MFTVTFYSFKGGVGRTLALMNVASELAKTGSNVAVLDFDLEAPGLETFACFEGNVPKLGLLDFLVQYSNSFGTESSIPEVKSFIAKAKKTHFTNPSDAKQRQPSWSTTTKTGDIYLLPARGSKSTAKLEHVDFKHLYEKQNGFMLFEVLRERIKAFTDADYLLVDSRTGFGAHSYICTNQLADALVVLFFPNIQNEKGVVEVVSSIKKYGTLDEDKILFAASRIPVGDDEQGLVEGNIERLCGQLGLAKSSILRLHHNSSFSLLDQELFTLTRTENTQLYRDYLILANEIEKLNYASKRGSMLFIKDLKSYSLEQVPSPSVMRRITRVTSVKYDETSQKRLDSIAKTFPNDLALNTELADLLLQDRFLSSSNDDKIFLHTLLAFLQKDDAKKINGKLSYNPTDGSLCLDSFRKYSGGISSIDQQTIGELFDNCYGILIDAEEAIGDEDEKITIDLQNSHITIGAILDQCAQRWLEKYEIEIEKKWQNFGPTQLFPLFVGILLKLRDFEIKKGVTYENPFSETDEWVLYSVPNIVKNRILDDVYSNAKETDAYQLLKLKLNESEIDLVGLMDYQNHMPILVLANQEQGLAGISFSELNEIFDKKIVRPNRFLRSYLRHLHQYFVSRQSKKIKWKGRRIKTDGLGISSRTPLNRLNAYWVIVHLFDMRDGNDGKVTLRKRILESLERLNAQPADSMDEVIVHENRLFSEIDFDISQSSNVSSQEPADTPIGKTRSLDVERINVMKQRQVMADEMPIYDSYFSFLQLKKIPLNDLIEESKFLITSKRDEIEKKLMILFD